MRSTLVCYGHPAYTLSTPYLEHRCNVLAPYLTTSCSLAAADMYLAGTGMRTTLHDISSRLPTFAFPDNNASSLSSLEERSTSAQRHPYFVGRNPPLNDLHPPIVSTTPYDKEAMKWMLQPPPPASIMAGKQRVERDGGRSRAESGASTLPSRSSVGLGRIGGREADGDAR